MRDKVARLDAGLVSGRVLGRCDDLHRFILKRNRQAKAAIFAINLCLQRAEVGFVEEGTVRIEAGQHSLNRAFHQLLVIDLVDIA